MQNTSVPLNGGVLLCKKDGGGAREQPESVDGRN
jgi:hypothetical protein